MAHFTKVEDGIVVQVLVIGNDDIADENGDQQESKGIALCNKLYGDATWVQTSYNNNFRKQYAGSGFTYDSVKDKFICPQPFASWALDENDDWQAPIPYPEDDESLRKYYWDEDTTSWKELET